MSYRIEYTPRARDHLAGLRKQDATTVVDTVGRKLAETPTAPTRSLKVLRANQVALYELRVGALRVYYDVEEGPDPVVLVKAVGVKDRSLVRIGGEVIEL